MMRRILIILIFCMGMVANAMNTLVLPTIPDSLTSPEDRAGYLTLHYWDNFDFSDTTLISKSEITEQEFVNFTNLLPMASSDKAGKAIVNMLDKALNSDSTMFAHFVKLSEKYFYDEESPFKNEEFYIFALNYIVDSKKIDSYSKESSKYTLNLAMKNRVGTKASDFEYSLPDGRKCKMWDIDADYLILMFNNPDCDECNELKRYMASVKAFTEGKIGDKTVAVLAIYADGDYPLWKAAKYPLWMINGNDVKCTIRNKRIYDIRHLPTLYLLDKNKYILEKDIGIDNVENYLRITK